MTGTTSELNLPTPTGTDNVFDYFTNLFVSGVQAVLGNKFAHDTGHRHTGATGDAPPLTAAGLANGSASGVVLGADVVTLVGSQTLTNKTLTSPTLNTPTLNTPTVTGPIKVPQPTTHDASQVTLDNTAAASISLAVNTSFAIFGDANNFGGLLLVHEVSAYGTVGLFLTGAGSLLMLGQIGGGSIYSTTQGTAGKINVYNINGTQWVENKTGNILSLSIMGFRTRSVN